MKDCRFSPLQPNENSFCYHYLIYYIFFNVLSLFYMSDALIHFHFFPVKLKKKDRKKDCSCISPTIALSSSSVGGANARVSWFAHHQNTQRKRKRRRTLYGNDNNQLPSVMVHARSLCFWSWFLFTNCCFADIVNAAGLFAD